MQIDKKKYPNCYEGHQYALDVISGKEIAGVHVINACNRYLRDIENPQFELRLEVAERFLRLVQQFEHVIGHWKTPTIVYRPWQKWLWLNVIGFYSKQTNNRRFRIAHIEIGRGNGKSALASQCALYFLALDNPKGNQISTIASRREQARIVLDSARQMAKKAASFRNATGVKVLAHSIIHERSNSKIRALSSDHTGLDGLQDILAICDELHAMKRETFDVVYSGMSKRSDSLTLCITTAGFDIDSVGFSQSAYAKKVSSGDVIDDQFFAAVYTIDDGDDIFDERVWPKANPGWGDSVDIETFRAKAKKAQEMPSDIPNFKVKHLNMWLSESQAFFDVARWDLCADTTLRLEDFAGEKCFVGVDLASKIDLTSIGFVFKKNDIYYVFDRSYIPEQTVKDVKNVLYDNCIGTGHLLSTPGEAIHYPNISKDVIEYSKKFKFAEVYYDPWNATSFAQELSKARLPMCEFRFNVSNLSEPTKNFDALIRQGKIRHNGSPLLRWCLGNVVCKYDAADNVFPKKNHERLKIDPIIAIIMAMAGHLQKDDVKSVYESRGIRAF